MKGIYDKYFTDRCFPHHQVISIITKYLHSSQTNETHTYRARGSAISL